MLEGAIVSPSLTARAEFGSRSSSPSLFQNVRIPASVENREDDYPFRLDDVEHAIGKAAGQYPPRFSVDHGIALRMITCLVECSLDAEHEIVTEAGLLASYQSRASRSSSNAARRKTSGRLNDATPV